MEGIEIELSGYPVPRVISNNMRNLLVEMTSTDGFLISIEDQDITEEEKLFLSHACTNHNTAFTKWGFTFPGHGYTTKGYDLAMELIKNN